MGYNENEQANPKDMEKYYEKQERECYRNIFGQEVYDIF